MKAIVGIQARSNSHRLPGKIYELIGAKPMLQWVYDACKAVKPLSKALTTETVVLAPQGDLKLLEFCSERSMPCCEGSEDDLVSRYMTALEKYDADMIIRVTGDCPMVQSEIIERVIKDLTECDYASNTIMRTFCEGFDVQGVSKEAMKWFYNEQEKDREHPFFTFDQNIIERKKFVKAGYTFRYVLDKRSPILLKLSVDSKEDLEQVRQYASLAR